jgi:hypothetical protein
MSKQATDKFLSEMFAFMEREYKRGALNKFPTIVTMTAFGVGQGLKEGYESIKSSRGDDWIDIDDETFTDFGRAAIQVVEKWASNPRTGGTLTNKTENDTVQYVTKTRDIQKPYTELKKAGVKELNKYLKSKGKRELTSGDRKTARTSEVGMVKSAIHRAHQGVTTVGSARISAALQFLERTRSFGGFVSAQESTEFGDIIKDIQMTFKTTGTKSGSQASAVQLIDEYVAIEILPISANRAGTEIFDFKNLKPKLEKSIRNYIEDADIPGLAGSKSIEENARDQTEYLILRELTKSKAIDGKFKTPKGRPKKNQTQTKKPKTTRTKKSTKKARGTSRKRQVGVSQYNIGSILGAMNAKINQKVEKNMGDPRLNNRTGRFASSVQVTDVALTPQGFPSIGYTYQKNPYQTFEVGYKQGTEDRDPRRLIEVSIREIAAEMAIGRLYTRRV